MNYTDKLEDVSAEMLEGFFVGWKRTVTAQEHMEILQNSYAVALAIDPGANRVVGFVTAMSDSFCAFIPLLEVLPEYQSKGIGTELMRRMLEKLKNYYGISLMCDAGLQGFYQRVGMEPGAGMNIRNFD